MKFRDEDFEIASPKFRNVFPNESELPALYLHMFQEDVRLRVVPVGGSRWEPTFAVSNSGTPDEIYRMEVLLRSLSREQDGDAEEIVIEAIRTVAAHILELGMARFEIIHARKKVSADVKQSETQPFYMLNSVTSKTVKRLPGCFVQIVPREYGSENGRSLVYAPASSMWIVNLPKALGGRSGYARLMRTLKGHTGIPKFYERELRLGNLSTTFQFSEFRQASRIDLLRSTRRWGWMGRDLTLDYETEFLLAYRTIRFHWATATLRDHITCEINKLLRSLHIDAQIRFDGILAPKEYFKIQGEFFRGEIDIATAYRKIGLT